MPRPKGGLARYEAQASDVDIALDELLSTPARPDRVGDPAEALELVRGGHLTDQELEQLRRRALECLEGVQASRQMEIAITTSPPEAVSRMRSERDAREHKWREVLEALDHAGPAESTAAA
jgi:hypothetical protein